MHRQLWRCKKKQSTYLCILKNPDGSIQVLRRLLSILMLAVFGLPFVAPLFAMGATNEASLPACCRRNGEHRCALNTAGRIAEQQREWGTPAKKCPYCPS